MRFNVRVTNMQLSLFESPAEIDNSCLCKTGCVFVSAQASENYAGGIHFFLKRGSDCLGKKDSDLVINFSREIFCVTWYAMLSSCSQFELSKEDCTQDMLHAMSQRFYCVLAGLFQYDEDECGIS